MDRITHVKLAGFKSIDGEYELDLATALEGPMGAGKSACLQAIRYAISGTVPEGKKDDLVANYFPPGGGRVVITDSAGRWIKRGIAVERKKTKKITRILETSDTPDDAKDADVSAWESTPVVVDIGAFLALSPDKRRQFVLRLCGSTEAAGAKLLDEVAIAYVKEVGGKAAKVDLLLDDCPDWEDFEEVEVETFRSWSQEAGVLELLQAELVGDWTISEAAARLAEKASKELHANRRSALEARAAANELETAAESARPRAEGLEDTKKRLGTVRSVHESAVSLVSRICAADDQVTKSTADLESAKARLGGAESKLEATEDPGREPAAPGHKTPAAVGKLAAVNSQIGELDTLIAKHESLKRDRDDAEKAVKRAEESLANHKTGDTAELVSAWEYLYESMGGSRFSDGEAQERMGNAVEACSVGWRKGLEQRIGKLDEARAEHQRLAQEVELTGGQERVDRTARTKLLQEREVLSREVSEAEQRHNVKLQEYRKKKAAHRTKKTARTNAEKAVEKARGEVEQASAALATAQASRAALGDETPDTDKTMAELESLERQVEEAHEAVGACKAFDDATAKARKGERLEAAWSVAQKAIKIAREKLVAEATKPIVDDMNTLLPEGSRAFLILEDERGSASFGIGMTLDDHEVQVGPLSDGWSTIFLSALSVAICRRSEGRRVLFVEGDHLDTWGLEEAMKLLAPVASELDACLLATSRQIPDVPGWTVFDVAPGGVQSRREVQV